MASPLMLVNPRKRRRKVGATKKRRSISRRKAPSVASSKTITTKRYRRNPSIRTGNIVATLKKGAIGSVGSIATSMLLSKIPLPAQLSTGYGRVAATVLGGVLIGYAVSKFGKQREIGAQMAQGAVTIALHNVIAPMVPGGAGLATNANDFLNGDEAYYNENLGWTNAAPSYDFDMDMAGYYEN